MKIKLIVCLLSIVLFGCSSESKPQKSDKRELLIYCGITMIHPMREIADIVEQQYNCTVTLMQGGSEDLYNSLKMSKKGDLYLPGSQSYRKGHIDEGLLADYIFVGHNQAALMVPKGNPRQITADIHNLTKKEYNVAIGNPESCSIGRQGKKVLTRVGIFDQVMNNALTLAADSRTMNKLLKDGTVDLILNWRATAYFPDNKDHVDSIVLPGSVAPKKKLLINLLTFSDDEELARNFMTLAGSPTGQQIFQKYGLLDDVGPARQILK